MLDYNKIVIKARNNVKKKLLLKKSSSYSVHRDPKTLRGYCAEVSKEISRLLSLENIEHYTVFVRVINKKVVTNHKIVHVIGDDLVLDGAIGQYDFLNNYVYERKQYEKLWRNSN